MGENRLMADLYEENQRLKARISELESKHFVDCTQIAQYSDENAKLKELLRKAVDDINYYVDCYEAHCDECCCDHDNHCHWKHADEALALIGEEGEQNG